MILLMVDIGKRGNNAKSGEGFCLNITGGGDIKGNMQLTVN